MMPSLRELVAAWEAQGRRCSQAFDVALAGINRELDAVGGYATTSPSYKNKDGVAYADGSGLCLSYYRQDDSFGGGFERAGERHGGTGPHADKVAPHPPMSATAAARWTRHGARRRWRSPRPATPSGGTS